MTEIVDERQRLVAAQSAVQLDEAANVVAGYGLTSLADIFRRQATAQRKASEGNKKGDGYTVSDTGGGFYRVPDPQGDVVGTFISREHADEYAQRCTARLASRPQEQPRKATDAEVEAASRAVVAEWQAMIQEHRGTLSAADSARAFVSPGNFRLIRAALEGAASVSPAAAQGWQMVPIKATDAMLDAGILAANKGTPDEGYLNGRNAVRDAWPAMLAAAPPSPAAQEQEKGEPT